MAKKKSSSRVDAVRDAVDQAFQTQIPRERISELLDELGNTAGRLRGAVDELRPVTAEELKSLRTEVRALADRVAALEKAKSTPRRTSTAKRATAGPAAEKARKTAAAKRPAPKRSAPKSS
ncbi:MAG: hypothetical protein ACRDLS_04830 [Solirubrobacteraceae bacterium]